MACAVHVPQRWKRCKSVAKVEHLAVRDPGFAAKKQFLNVNKHNSAKKFYESQGYKVYDEGVFDIENGYVMDDYLMEKML